MSLITNNTYKSFIQKFPNASCHSPISAALLFSLLGEISDDNSKSFLKSIIGNLISVGDHAYLLKSLNSDDLKLSNFVFIDKNYKLSDNLDETLGKLSKLESIEFDANTHNHLNQLIETFTNNLIKDFFNSELSGPIIMLNVGYFKCCWKTKFSSTKSEIFNSSNGPIEVATMHCSDESWYYENENVQLYYKKYEDGSGNCMIFVLPKNSITDFNVNNLEKYVNATEMYEVDVKIPKFKHTSEMSEIMDMTLLIAQKDTDQKFTSLPFHFKQKCVVEIDETQTCAAVASGLIAKCFRLPSNKKVNFHADRPFLYFVRNIKEKVILFAGKYDGK